TGGGRGFGRAIAETLARLGASGVIASRNAPELDEVAIAIKKAGGKALAQTADVADEPQVQGRGPATERWGAPPPLPPNTAAPRPPPRAHARADARPHPPGHTGRAAACRGVPAGASRRPRPGPARAGADRGLPLPSDDRAQRRDPGDERRRDRHRRRGRARR